ncbi:uncharacterized protein TNCV_1381191 [Trichonephila clavipes]|nr:uncharacterized protein TNCV_1381191 [Trichonephila clavipes]
MITNFFISELNNHDVQELWFQKDGATCHTARATIDLLKDTFGNRLISRFGPVNWPPKSCDLTPLDYFLWNYVKSLVYADKPQTLDHLEDNIRRLLPIYGHKCWKKSSKIGRPDWTTSEGGAMKIMIKYWVANIETLRSTAVKGRSPEVPEQMFRPGGQSGTKSPVLSSQASLVFIDPLKGCKAESTLSSPEFEPRTCGGEA